MGNQPTLIKKKERLKKEGNLSRNYHTYSMIYLSLINFFPLFFKVQSEKG